ncbi:uncharacterized protein J8A68_000084 [[Candida] subhashii]|uniref:Uncharacterized protein n=1 Tax=[Candida] subhashii TaxID=561895 RepID=A0A8J5QRX7_9ASCO|nr:uncharacterized protein J8A68_000084 [[Candida] subhashii]KAG7666388.1 hypothetical protein J8A68_000084 [[Candida] subhashii]
MDADYINTNFTTIEDLQELPTKLNELNQLSQTIQQIANLKTTSSDSNSVIPNAPQSILNQQEFDNALEKITSVISMISDPGFDLNDAIDNMNGLIAEYGPVSMFIQLKQQFEMKLDSIKMCELLKMGKSLEERLSSPELSQEELRAISNEINSLNDVNNIIAGTLITILRNKIQTKRQELETQLKQLIKNTKWLSTSSTKNNEISNESLTQISKLFQQLINLQSINNIPKYPASWWALDILLDPIIIRFNYHFNSTNKETNKLSKPEWAFNFIETFLSNDIGLINLIVEDTFKQVGRIGLYEIITSLLNPLRIKIQKMLTVINENIITYSQDKIMLEKNGRLLSHLIFELSSFDQRLRTIHKYNPYIYDFQTGPESKWNGITSDVLLINRSGSDSNVAVENWLNFENELATKRFQTEIITTKDAFTIDYDYQGTLELGDDDDSGSHIHKYILRPTYSAYGLVKLINNLSSHYQTLNIVKYQLKYVSKIQLNLIDKYLDSLNRQYRTFLEKFNFKSVLNYIPGGIKETIDESSRIEQGQRGLTMLTELYCSGKFISNSLEYWSNQLIFIQLWQAYKSYSGENVDDYEDSSIFESAISQYDDFINRLINDYEDFFKGEIKQLVKQYVNSSQWELNSTIHGDYELPSDDLSTIVNTLPTYLEILRRSLSTLDYFMIVNQVVSIICNIYYEYIITNNQFDRKGVDQLLVDFGHIVTSLHILLFLNCEEHAEFSCDGNDSYVKVCQAIDLLDSLDKNKRYSPDNDYQELRKEYEHGLSMLTRNELHDLIARVI